MKIPLLTIVIPCYNSARHLSRTLDMLLEQDMSDCDLVLVNDGSVDDTLGIMQAYADRHDFIRICNQCNCGVAEARNSGLRMAIGKYVYFFDSDDSLTPGTVAYFKTVLNMHPDCRMYAFGYQSRRDGKKVKNYSYHDLNDTVTDGAILTQSFLKKKFCVNICSSIYERRYLLEHNLYFKKGQRIGEDIHFLIRAMYGSGRVFYSDRISFVYQLNDDSAMQGYRRYHVDYFYMELLIGELGCLPEWMHYDVNLFLVNFYISNLLFYMRSPGRNAEVERLFGEYREVLSRPLRGVNIRRTAAWVLRHVPPGCIFRLKRTNL